MNLSISLTGRIDIRRTWWGGKRVYVEVRYAEDELVAGVPWYSYGWEPMTERHIVELNTQVTDLRDEIKELIQQRHDEAKARSEARKPSPHDPALRRLIAQVIAEQKLPGGCLSELSPIRASDREDAEIAELVSGRKKGERFEFHGPDLNELPTGEYVPPAMTNDPLAAQSHPYDAGEL